MRGKQKLKIKHNSKWNLIYSKTKNREWGRTIFGQNGDNDENFIENTKIRYKTLTCMIFKERNKEIKKNTP